MGERKPRTQVTAELLQIIQRYLNDPKYKNLTDQEVAMLSNVSLATIGRVKHGDYDYLLNPNPPLPQNVVHATIEFEQLQHLFSCEQLVKDLLEVSKLSDLGEDELYFPRRITHSIFKKHVPDLVAKRLEYLSTEATDSYIN